MKYLCISVIEHDDYSYLSKNENRIENLGKKIFFSIFELWNIYINICVNDDYEYIWTFEN